MGKTCKWFGAVVAGCLVGSGSIAQEHSYAPADIEAGRGYYQANCLGCHGNNGDAVNGADLSKGQFRHAGTDEELIGVIRNGIPETPMPSHTQLSTETIRSIVAFLRALPTGGGIVSDERDIAIGNAGRGESLFFGSAECSTCHGVNGGGSRLSPDLGDIGARRSAGELQDSMLDANAQVRAGQRFYRVLTRDGREVNGLLLNRSTHSVQLLDENERLVSFSKDELQEYGFTVSPMPSYRDVLSSEQVADLVAYMISLKAE